MLRKLFKKTQADQSVDGEFGQEASRSYPVVQRGEDLLNTQARQHQIRRVKRLISTSEDVWDRHYLHAIRQFAEIVQGAPASEIHHHAYHGGLIDHTLEVLAAGVQLSQGYMLPPNSEPEELHSGVDKWRFGVIIAILSHDIGKVVTDMEFVYRERGEGFTEWHPWFGIMPVGAEYHYRYRTRLKNSSASKGLHEKASMSLVPLLLTKGAVRWLFSDQELVGQLFHTISSSTIGGGAIADIVRKADSNSVGRSLGADPGKQDKSTYTTEIPLEEKIIVCLRQLIADGALRMNKPGAALWCTESHTWVVSRVAMDAVRNALKAEGHKGIPNSSARLYNILLDSNFILPADNGEAVWYAKIVDHARSWEQGLSFLCFENSTVWPTSQPTIFDGEVVPTDSKGNTLHSAPLETETSNAGVERGNGNENPQAEESVRRHDEVKQGELPLVDEGANAQQAKVGKEHREAQGFNDRGNASSNRASSTAGEHQAQEGEGGQQQSNGPAEKKTDRRMNKFKQDGRAKVLTPDEVADFPLFKWLLPAVSARRLKVNEPKAPIHILGDFVALVTPTIFTVYIDKSLTSKVYEKQARESGKPVFTVLQRELFSLGIHQTGANGENIVKVTVTGKRNRSELSVVLIPRKYLPGLSKFSGNPALSLKD
jgi:integrating conjugative element relaxase (TIGR03760 family)